MVTHVVVVVACLSSRSLTRRFSVPRRLIRRACFGLQGLVAFYYLYSSATAATTILPTTTTIDFCAATTYIAVTTTATAAFATTIHLLQA